VDLWDQIQHVDENEAVPGMNVHRSPVPEIAPHERHDLAAGHVDQASARRSQEDPPDRTGNRRYQDRDNGKYPRHPAEARVGPFIDPREDASQYYGKDRRNEHRDAGIPE